VFEQGIGWYVEPAEFEAATVEPVRSSPEEITECATEYMNSVLQGARDDEESPSQRVARTELARAKGERGVAMHGEIRSRQLDSFLAKHGDFLQPHH